MPGSPAETGLTLAIETSNPGAGAGGVALARVRDDGVEFLGERDLAPSGRHDDALMPAVDALLTGAGLGPRDLHCVAVSIGPGGYTSVRIAVMTAKAICEATGAHCIGVPTASVAAAGYAGDAERVLVTLASKRGACWAASVSTSDTADVDAWGIVDAESIAERVRASGMSVALVDEHLPDTVVEALRGAGVRLESICLRASACLRAAMRVSPVDPAELVPIYPREPEAVRKWRTLRAND